jgi:hypothetical protein
MVIGLSDEVGRSQNALRQHIIRGFCDRNHIQGSAGSLFRTTRYLGLAAAGLASGLP